MTTHIQVIIDAIKRQEHHNAENLCWSALKKQPNSPEIYKWLGIALLQQKKYEGAVEAFLKSLPGMKNDFDVINNLSFGLRHLEDYEEALMYLDKAEKILPNQYAVSVNRANIFFNLKRYDEALEQTENCYKLIKDVHEGNYASHRTLRTLYVEIQLAKNEIDKAVDVMTKELKDNHDSFDAKLFFNLSNTAPEKVDEIVRVRAKEFALDKNEFFLNRSAAFLGLGRLSEKEKNYGDAFENYRSANQIKAEKLRYKPFLAQEIVKNIIKYFNKDCYSKMYKNFDKDYIDKGKNLIFIVGNPRSGTTLVESILGSSDNITSAGELSVLGRLIPDEFMNISPDTINKIGDDYLRIIKNFDKENIYQFIIDKMPGNIYYVGFIKLCFPSAKIICLNRRPLDNAWSIFTQFYLGNIPYSSDLFNLGLALSNVEALKKVWLSQNNEKNFYLADYEKIVSDPQTYTKEIYNFVGVDAQYDEEKRKKFSSRTASKNQIKKDIYTSSISRSKDYDIYLGEFEKSYNNQNEFWNKYLKDHNAL